MIRFKSKICLLVTAFAAALSACDFRVERDYRDLVYRFANDPATLNPITLTEANGNAVNGFIFDQLLQRDNETLAWKPMLAEKWVISPDKLQYTFYLRNDVYWHDGEKFTADDVLFTLETIKNPKVDAVSWRAYFNDVTKAEKLDDYTVRFTCAVPYYRAINMLGTIPLVPKHVFEKDATEFNKHPFGRHPVGMGPYKFKEWKDGRKIVLERFDNYWGDKPHIKGITFRIVNDSAVALQVLKKEEIDIMSLQALQWIKQTNSKKFEKQFDKYKYYLPGYSFIAWNPNRPFFEDKRVRRAMTMLVNRQEILEKLYFGLGELVTGPEYKFGPYYDSSISPISYNPVEAEKLLSEAGWIDTNGDGIKDKNGVPFKFTLMIPGGRFYDQLSNVLRENFKRVGIEMDVSRFEWAVFIKNLNDRSFDATTLGWTGQVDPDEYQVWHSSQIEKGSNLVSFKNDELDEILVQSRAEFEAGKRHSMYKRLHQILYQEQPYTFLFSFPSLVTVNKRFTNVKVYKLGVDIREWGVEKPPRPLYQ